MKRRFLVAHDYGMGSLWWYVDARSEREIRQTFAEAEVVTGEPEDPDIAVVDIDDPATYDEALTGMRATRDAQRDRPGFGALAGRPMVWLRRAWDPGGPEVYLMEIGPDGRRVREVELTRDGPDLREDTGDWAINPPVVDLYDPGLIDQQITREEFERAWDTAVAVRLVPWSEDDLGLLRRINVPEMRKHVGGPETDEKVLVRHRRYLALPGGEMFRIALNGEAAGSIGFWSRQWQQEQVYESGWTVLPEFQGRGVASLAVREVIALAASDGRHRWLYAFPAVDNAASNAVCRRTGFTLVGESDFEYPPGRMMRSNVWRHDLTQ